MLIIITFPIPPAAEAPVSLPPGTQIGSFEIVGLVGAGGMGEVYRARDPQLGRDVAIKVLPPGFGGDPARVRRFELEARALAALNHPNVLAVHAVGNQGGAPYLVMELLVGETLRDRLRRGPVPVREAVPLALQMARGLAAAHGKGLVHRDLKPANLFITEDGTLKILDFGLARQAGLSASGAEETQGLSDATGTGVLLGTAGYMAPEQVSGQTADVRSDIFAFGVVLYEMLSGTGAFRRSGTIETLHATLHEDPPELTSAAGPVPPALQRLVEHCLEKDPARRFQHVQDLLYDLEADFAGHSSAGATTRGLPVVRGRARLWLPAAGALVLALLAGLLRVAPWKPKPPPYDPRCVAILPFENHTGDPGLDPLGLQARDRIRQLLQMADHLKIAADPGAPPAGEAAALRLAQGDRARFVALGSYFLRGGELELQARLIDPWTGKVVYTLGPWRGPRSDPAQAVEALGQSVSGAIAWSFRPAPVFEPGSTHAPRMDAYLAFDRAQAAAATDQGAYFANCERALALDPEFFWVRWSLLDTYSDSQMDAKAAEVLAAMEARFETCYPVERIWISYCRGYLMHDYRLRLRALEGVLAIHPENPMLAGMRAMAEVQSNLPRRAIRDLENLPLATEKLAGDLWQWPYMLAEAYHMVGDYPRQLRSARESQAAFPGQLYFQAEEVGALAALGRPAEIEGVLRNLASLQRAGGSLSASGVAFRAVAELRAHGQVEASRRIAARLLAELRSQPAPASLGRRRGEAGLLMFLDRVPEALDAFRAMAAEAESDGWRAHFLGLAGCALARLGRTGEARRAEAGIAALRDPYLFGENTYHRAAIAAQLGEKDRAVALLGQAFAEGSSYYNEEWHLDLNLEPLRGYGPYEELVKPRD